MKGGQAKNMKGGTPTKNQVLQDILNLYDEKKNPDVKYLDVERDGQFVVIVGFKDDSEIKIKIDEVGQVGRPLKIDFEEIQKLKNQGMTQEQIARHLEVSVSTIRRHWK